MNACLGNFHFRVDWGGARLDMVEVSGLAMSLEVLATRSGASLSGNEVLEPGNKHCSPVVLKRALLPGDRDFYTWFSSAMQGDAERRDVVITLLNGRHEPAYIWKLQRAFPSKLEFSPLNALGNEVAMESLTLVHEGLVVMH